MVSLSLAAAPSQFLCPGHSPGVLSVATLDGGQGMDFQLEMTASDISGNDLVRITHAFASPLSGINHIDVLLGKNIHLGDTLPGGFFLDAPSDTAELLNQLRGADWQGWVEDEQKTLLVGGKHYRPLDDRYILLLGARMATVAFGTATQTGALTQLTLALTPEPAVGLLAASLLLSLAGRPRVGGPHH